MDLRYADVVVDLRTVSEPDLSYHDKSRYQAARASAIGANWIDGAAALPALSYRDDETLVPIDGVHRIRGALLGGVTHMACRVFYGLTIAQESNLYLLLSSSVSNTFGQKWVARRALGDEIVLAVEQIAASAGVMVHATGGARVGECVAVQVLEHIYLRGPVLLRGTLDMIGLVWAGDKRAYQGMMLRGIASFMATYAPGTPGSWDKAATPMLRDRLEARGPSGYLAALRQIREEYVSFGMGSPTADPYTWRNEREAVLRLYNHGLRHPLPSVSLQELRAAEKAVAA